MTTTTLLADELRNIANEELEKQKVKSSTSIANYIKKEAKLAAKKGLLSLTYWLDTQGWSKQDANAAAAELRKEGFATIVDSEITAHYSNTDCDQEDFIKVSWE